MKLKQGVIIERTKDGYVAVATGEAGKHFNGLVRNNSTANFVFEQLQTEKTEEELVEALLCKYDVSREKAAKDVAMLISKIRQAGLLDG